MSKKKFTPQLGQRVTSTVENSAYGYERTVFFRPGDVGVVAAIDVPAVRAPFELKEYRDPYNGVMRLKKTYPRGRNPVFACVDFERNGRTYRTSFYYDQLKEVEL